MPPRGEPSRRIVRAPNHLGDVAMALPALAEAGDDVMVVERLAPILEMADLGVGILPLRRGFRGFWSAVGRLRAGGYREGVLMSAAFSAALLFRTGGVARLRGTATDGRTFLVADPIPREALGDRHRILQYHFLLGQPGDRPLRNHRIDPPGRERQRWADELGRGPRVALFPGSNAPARRWPAERFRAVARRLADAGVQSVVLGGPGERELTAAVARGVPGAVDAGGRTDLPGLAGLLSLCELLLTNDTGPMHLAGLVGTPTVTLWGSSDPAEVHPVGSRDVRLRTEPLPCMPCKKNVCPRRGAGTRLERAENECLHLIEVEEALDAVERLLSDATPVSGGFRA